MISTCLRYTQRKGGGDPRPVVNTREETDFLKKSASRKTVNSMEQKTLKSFVKLMSKNSISDLVKKRGPPGRIGIMRPKTRPGWTKKLYKKHSVFGLFSTLCALPALSAVSAST